MNLKKKRVLITGAASGIGFCLAEEFGRAGSKVVITDIAPDRLADAVKRLKTQGIRVHSRVENVTKRPEVEACIRWAINKLGGIDILINNAGIGHHSELEETTIEDWRKLVEVNLFGPLYHIYALLPFMKKKGDGCIVNVSSGQKFFRLPTWGAYASIKAALGTFSEILHFELRKYNIRVTTVYPFMVNTPFYDKIKKKADQTWGDRMSMKLLPYYSQTPQKVARIIRKAVEHETKVEMVSFMNDVAFYAQFIPFASDFIAMMSDLLLAKPERSLPATRRERMLAKEDRKKP